ncbi:MAG: alpha/beta hydrolase [Rhodospirillaceae bacterium TMED8]|nr:alpha/beta hydrolase [Magnetovibrio sp.]OUT48950.1 MAG: alpha/beta hydrolase [Rhodospirillaceae bacterium TMED8]
MSSLNILVNGSKEAFHTICLAHGAGAPMDSPFMQAFAEGLAARDFIVARFEFPYMAERRESGQKKPPNHPKILIETWRTVIKKLRPSRPLIIGGKSMGGRMASFIADQTDVAGLVCLGYPFHAPRVPPHPDRLKHLERLKTPTLICQGTRDPFGTKEEVKNYALSARVQLQWLEDGDHSFKPRKKSCRTQQMNWETALDSIVSFTSSL